MLVTIGIPVYNRVYAISKCIESVLSQETSLRFNVLIVDNCSNDGTKEILKKYSTLEQVKVVFNTHNVGLANNWTKVFNYSEADYTYLLHSDDIMNDGALEKINQYLIKHKRADFIFGNVDILKNDCIQRGVFKKKYSTGYISNAYLLNNYYYKGLHPAPPQTWIVRKGVVKAMGGFIDNICCDFNMSFKIIASEYKIGYINESLATWVLHEDNIGGGKYENHRKALINSIEDLKDNYRAYNIELNALLNIDKYLKKYHMKELLLENKTELAAEIILENKTISLLNINDVLLLVFYLSRINLIYPLRLARDFFLNRQLK